MSRKLVVKGDLPPIIWMKTRTVNPAWLSTHEGDDDIRPMCGHVYLILPDNGSVREIRQIADSQWIIAYTNRGEKGVRYAWYNKDNLLHLSSERAGMFSVEELQRQKNEPTGISTLDRLQEYLSPEALSRLESIEEARSQLVGWVLCLPLRKATLKMLLSQKGVTAGKVAVHGRIGDFAQMFIESKEPIYKVDGLFVVPCPSFNLWWARDTYQPKVQSDFSATYPVAGCVVALPRNVYEVHRSSILSDSFADDFTSLVHSRPVPRSYSGGAGIH